MGSLSKRDTRSRLKWFAAVVAAPCFGIVTAFGVTAPLNDSVMPLHTVVEAIALPEPAAQAEPAATSQRFWHEERVQRGDTVAALLNRLGVDDAAAVEFLRVSREAHSFHQLRPGRGVTAVTSDSGELQSLRYSWNDRSMFVVERNGGAFHVTEQALSLRPRLQMKSAEIRSSLFAATDASGVPDNIAVQMAEVFAGDIDFHRDLRRGDRFVVVYEMFDGDGDTTRPGRLLAAEFVNQNRFHRAVYFEDAAHRGGYYGADGKNLRKAFLRSPLAFTRISSGFTNSRFHPIFKQWRAHRGVDYAAPMGTPVRATADGTVEIAAVHGGYGKEIVLRHQGKYATLYGHLSRYASGIRAGARVTQGEVIGYVGATGWATGPHLHYEFLVGGTQTNPLSVALPTALPLAGASLGQFHSAAAPLLARLDLLRNSNLASLE